MLYSCTPSVCKVLKKMTAHFYFFVLSSLFRRQSWLILSRVREIWAAGLKMSSSLRKALTAMLPMNSGKSWEDSQTFNVSVLDMPQIQVFDEIITEVLK